MGRHQVFKTAILISLSVTLALFLTSCSSASKANTTVNSNSNAAPTTVDVTTKQAVIQNMPTYFEATGNLSSDAQTDVSPTVGGKIIEVNFDIGSYVNKGDVLVRIDPRDAQIRLDQALRQVEQQKAQVEQVRATVGQAEAGVNQAIANLRQTQIRLGLTEGSNFDINKFSQVIATKAQLDLAEKELKRAEKLLETGDVSRSFYDQRLATRNQLLGNLEESKSNAAISIKAILTAQEAVNVAKAQVATANANVKTAEAALNTSLTSVDQARKAVSDTAVYAPISGYVSERVADLGEFTNPNTPNAKIATIIRTSVLRMRIDVPEQSIGQVKLGQTISLQTSAYPDRNFAGIVTRISPSVNATSRTLVVEAEVENGENKLKPGQFATARITQSKAKPTVMIPTVAVKTEGDTSKVFVIKDGRATERTVKLGVLEGDQIEVQQGVAEGEMVVVSNLNQVYDGVTVRQ
jgi:RND family efflux transporter MFP subunit